MGNEPFYGDDLSPYLPDSEKSLGLSIPNREQLSKSEAWGKLQALRSYKEQVSQKDKYPSIFQVKWGLCVCSSFKYFLQNWGISPGYFPVLAEAYLVTIDPFRPIFAGKWKYLMDYKNIFIIIAV